MARPPHDNFLGKRAVQLENEGNIGSMAHLMPDGTAAHISLDIPVIERSDKIEIRQIGSVKTPVFFIQRQGYRIDRIPVITVFTIQR